MEIAVRLATARDRKALEMFYNREGIEFQTLRSIPSISRLGEVKETMFVVGVTEGMVVSALKLDIIENPKIGRIGLIQHFEIEDELEDTDLGERMLTKVIGIAEERELNTLDTIINVTRTDVISLFTTKHFTEISRQVHLRRKFRKGLFG